ncbi:hypothetical protein [Streptomyces sp. NPDC003036]|uniref:hypothetical protein n=1 Tax=Streptomyces sp. NPDC003036 TaxID=3154442 RepID=UPI0033AC1B7B
MRLVPDDDPLDGMRVRLEQDEALLGYEPQEGFADRCWVLHTIHEGVVRLRWNAVLARAGRRLEDWEYTPSWRVFDGIGLADDADGPSGGEIDRECLVRLVGLLARHSPDGLAAECYWAQAAIHEAGRPVTVWRGRLGEAPAFHDTACSEEGSAAAHFPAQWWPLDRSWYVLTDWDLSATEVFGSPDLVAALLVDDELDAVRHPGIAEVLNDEGRDARWRSR